MARRPKQQVPRPSSNWLVALAVAGLLACYFILATSAAAEKSNTVDEGFHLAGGYSFWEYGDFRVQPASGNLPQRWVALPLVLGGYRFPSLNQDSWRSSWMESTANQFLFSVGNDAREMLWRARAMVALLGVMLGAVIFEWNRRCLGLAPAFTSLTLFTFCPTMLSHGALATSDMTATLVFLLSIGGIWMVLNRVTWKRLLASAVAMGLLFVSKFNAAMIIPMGLVLMSVQLASARPMIVEWGSAIWKIDSRARRLAAQLGLIAVHGVVVWIIIWAFFDFRFSIFNNVTRATDERTGQSVVVDHLRTPWDVVAPPDGGAIARTIVALRDWHFLPEAYLYGAAHTLHFAQARLAGDRLAFLDGETSAEGFLRFFPCCLLYKTPLTLFALMALGAGAIVVCRWRAAAKSERLQKIVDDLYGSAPLWTLFVVYWSFSIPSHLNIGLRHLMPTYPPMLMLAGAAALWFRSAEPTALRAAGKAQTQRSIVAWLKSRPAPMAAAVTVLCVSLFVGESAATWPNYLAYFNQTVGGSWNGHRHLIDSSLDWGQDLPALGRWVRAERISGNNGPIYLRYFGTGNPRYFGVECTPIPEFPPHVPEPLAAGAYCISASSVAKAYSPLTGPWNTIYEDDYQKLASLVRALELVRDNPQERKALIERLGGEAAVLRIFQEYEMHRFTRLCAYLRKRGPDEEINYSILIYRLSDADIDRAVNGPPPELAPNPTASSLKDLPSPG